MFYMHIIDPDYPENWIEYYKKIIEKSRAIERRKMPKKLREKLKLKWELKKKRLKKKWD